MPKKRSGTNWKNETYPAMTSENTDYIELIPDYLNGILDRETKSRFEEALATDPELKRELDEFRELQTLYKEALPETPEPSDELFGRILDKIDEVEQSRYRNDSSVPSLATRLGELWGRFKHSLTIPWGLAMVQAAVIVFLLIPHLPEKTFDTLGFVTQIPGADQKVEGEMVSFNIVFNESSSEAEIRELLLSISAAIISGPSLKGRYQIAIPGGNERVLSDLRQSELILFVEKAY